MAAEPKAGQRIVSVTERRGKIDFMAFVSELLTGAYARARRAHQMNTTLNPAQEVIFIEIRRLCLLALDNLVSVTRQFINADPSRSGISRLLRREGLSKLADLAPKQEDEDASKTIFKDYKPGSLHIDAKYLAKMPDESSRSSLFVVIDCATRWVFLRIYGDQTELSSVDFLRRVQIDVPLKINKLLTDNGTQFTDHFTSKRKPPTGHHVFDQQCEGRDIGHRLSPPRPRRPMGWLRASTGASARQQSRFASGAQLQAALNNYMLIYNHHIPQGSMGHLSPVDALKSWQEKNPELFLKRVYKQAELDSYALPDPIIE